MRIELECIDHQAAHMRRTFNWVGIYIHIERESCQGTECVSHDMIKDGDSLNERQRIKRGDFTNVARLVSGRPMRHCSSSSPSCLTHFMTQIKILLFAIYMRLISC